MKAISSQTQSHYFPLLELSEDILPQIATHLFTCRDDIQSFSLTCKKFCLLNFRWPYIFRERIIQNIGLSTLEIPQSAKKILEEYQQKTTLSYYDGTKFCCEWTSTLSYFLYVPGTPFKDSLSFFTGLMGTKDPSKSIEALIQKGDDIELLLACASFFESMGVDAGAKAFHHPIVKKYGYEKALKLITKFASKELYVPAMVQFLRYGSFELLSHDRSPPCQLFEIFAEEMNGENLSKDPMSETDVDKHPFIQVLVQFTTLPKGCIPTLIHSLIIPLSKWRISFACIKKFLDLIPQDYDFDLDEEEETSQEFFEYCLDQLEGVPDLKGKNIITQTFIHSVEDKILNKSLKQCVVEFLLNDLYESEDLDIESLWPFLYQVERHFNTKDTMAEGMIQKNPEFVLHLMEKGTKSIIDLFSQYPDFLERIEFATDIKIELYQKILELLPRHGVVRRAVIASIPQDIRTEVLRTQI